MVLSFPRFRLFIYIFYCVSRCLPTKRIKTNRGLVSVVTFALRLTHIITALPVGNLARVMIPVSLLIHPVKFVLPFTEEQLIKITHRKHYVKKQKKGTTSSKDNELDLGYEDVDSFTGSHTDLESAADNLFTSPPHPQPLPFSSLSLKTPAKTVPPTPGTALQQKIESNLEKSLGNTLNIHVQQKMGSFQAYMLEAFQFLQDELTTKKQTEVDQTSTSASKPGPSSSAVNLDLPPPRPRPISNVEKMEVDYGPALPPRLSADHHNASHQLSSPSKEPSKKASDRPKKHSHSH